MTPLDYTYPIDRLNYPGGDNGYAVPIGTCPKGTIFATFSAWSDKAVEREPMSRITKFDTGTGWPFIDSRQAGGSWIQGHHPKLGICECSVPTVPLFIDEVDRGVLKGQRLELHETWSGGTPSLEVQATDLLTNQRGRTRSDGPTSLSNSGDSGVPRFIRIDDGLIAFIGQEITLNGIASNWPVYLEMLATIPGAVFNQVRLDDVGPPPPEDPAPEPDQLARLQERVSSLEKAVTLLKLAVFKS